MQFTINKLSAGVEAPLLATVVAWKNERHEMIAQNFESADMAPIASDIHTPDFLAIARAYGWGTMQARTLKGFKIAVIYSSSLERPTLIEVKQGDFLQ